MKTLIIARHGNTFPPGVTPTRIGSRTDLPLAEEERARSIGRYLRARNIIPTRILAAPLQRTLATACLAAQELGNPCPVCTDTRFSEIDYGPDENKTEAEVQLRLGQAAAVAAGLFDLSAEQLNELGAQTIALWNSRAVVPPGWVANPTAISRTWQELAKEIAEDEVLLCVSSNGILRFAPVITGDYTAFCAQHDIKVPTGGVCIFTACGNSPWQCIEWGVKAFRHVPPS